ncbi:MAG: MBL fold metallo-hydrolase [Bacilli bacterium]|nr:MBL fold metallo-hydrolase [Bacilli bacterium]MDD4607539.1 MBL fold metallo-hydrolase [Bacilli bacterium]
MEGWISNKSTILLLMKICVLASGSQGNCTYIETMNHKILIDLGTNLTYTTSQLNSIGIDPKEIDTILITHTHGDHVNGLSPFIRKYNPTIYLSEKMHEELKIKLKNYYYLEDILVLDDTIIEVIKLSHDKNDINGYIIESEGKNLVYITDTGYINQKYHSKLKNKNIYIMESNHDVEMVMNCSRPHFTKMRIISDKGHLSNKDSAKYLSKFIGESTKNVILAHLSADNNTQELALTTLQDALRKKRIDFDNITVAKQEKRIELIEI